ncbi:MAG: hypothetical protein HQM13_00990 [SAR324 cluster bacterium]|nr:hypothetical protein [SAR324 cluster bacterium]
MSVEMLDENQVAVIYPPALEDIHQWEKELNRIEKLGCRFYLIDLSLIDWLPSSEFGVIMWTFKHLEESGRKLYLLVDSPVLFKTFETTSLDQMIPIFSSREEVLAIIRQQ